MARDTQTKISRLCQLSCKLLALLLKKAFIYRQFLEFCCIILVLYFLQMPFAPAHYFWFNWWLCGVCFLSLGHSLRTDNSEFLRLYEQEVSTPVQTCITQSALPFFARCIPCRVISFNNNSQINPIMSDKNSRTGVQVFSLTRQLLLDVVTLQDQVQHSQCSECQCFTAF